METMERTETTELSSSTGQLSPSELRPAPGETKHIRGRTFSPTLLTIKQLGSTSVPNLKTSECREDNQSERGGKKKEWGGGDGEQYSDQIMSKN
jgi:hypothetical protein